MSLPTSHAIMVPPGSRHSLALFLSCAVIAANPAKAGDPLMQTVDSGRSDLAESSESTKGHLTAFPGENPSELELVRWLELAKDRLRVLKLLPYALSADPPVPAEYAEKTAIPEPAGERGGVRVRVRGVDVRYVCVCGARVCLRERYGRKVGTEREWRRADVGAAG